MAKAIFREFSFPLIASVVLACLPSPVLAQRGDGFHKGSNADGQWHSFAGSRENVRPAATHGSDNARPPSRSNSGESGWHSFGTPAGSRPSSFRGRALAARQPASNPPTPSANIALAPALANPGFGFNDFGFGCFGCGSSFRFGLNLGSPWGWGSWWGPPWGWSSWNPFWFEPWYNPWWSWRVNAPPAIDYNGSHDQIHNNSPSYSPPPSNSPDNSSSPSLIAQGSQQASNVENARAAVHLYLKDGGTYWVNDCWMAYGRLHYTFSDGAESTIGIDQLDLQRTLDENSQHLCTIHEAEPRNPTLSTERK